MTSVPAPAAAGGRHDVDLRALSREVLAQAEELLEGGGRSAIERQHSKGRKTARERITALLDPGSPTLEIGLWAAYQMYEEWGGAPSAGVVTVIGSVAGRRVMVVANDATVKAGACFPLTIKKILRAQRIAAENRLPLVYLVDSSGVFLPMQDEVFPGRGRLRPHLSQQCRAVGAGHPAIRRDHGQLRCRRRLSSRCSATPC